MSEPDLKTTLREFKEYVDLTYEPTSTIAARIGVTQPRIWDWLAGKCQPKAKSLAKLRRFLDAEARRPAQGDGIRPIERVPFKIIKPVQQVRYARICPFCRKARGRDSVNRCKAIPGQLPEMRSERAETRWPSGSAQGVEWEGMIAPRTSILSAPPALDAAQAFWADVVKNL
jgi:transcriptional regulator with XRE-family HTH domain